MSNSLVDFHSGVDGFVEWGRRESKGGMLAALAHSGSGSLGKYRKPVTLDAAHSREAHTRARRKYGSGHAQRETKRLGVAIAAAELHHDGSAKYELEKKRKKLDGRVKAVASSTTMARLVSDIEVSYEDLHNLRVEFAEASDRSGKDGPYLTCDRLKEMLLARFPSLENGRVLSDMLRVFDVNNNNKIYFPEFAKALSKLVGSFEEQMSFIFDLCDKDADGQLELWELSDLISDAADDMNELGDHIKSRVPAFDDGLGFVDMLEFEALLKSDAQLYLNFFWTWVPYIGGNLLLGLELFEQVALAVGVRPDVELALKMCPMFSAAAGLSTAGDFKISSQELAEILFGVLGLPVPDLESFRDHEAIAGAAKDDGETPRPAEKVGAAVIVSTAETPRPLGALQSGGATPFFATPAVDSAAAAPLVFKLSKATALIYSEMHEAHAKRTERAEGYAGETHFDQFGQRIVGTHEDLETEELPAARIWATVAHFLASRGTAGATKSTRNLDALSPSALDFDAGVAVTPGGESVVHPGRLSSVPQAVQAAILSRVVAFEYIEHDYHPDPVVSPSSRNLPLPPDLPKIPVDKILAFADDVCKIHSAWEITLAEAFAAMDANQDGSVSFDELLRYSRMNRELFQLMIGTGNRKTKGLIEYDAGKISDELKAKL